MFAEASFLALMGILLPAALFAGFVDAVVGGGGLIQIPALFSVLPRELPATIFGTNKVASVFGTLGAAWRYAGRVKVPWPAVLPTALMAFAFSYGGAAAVAWLSRDALRPLILGLLVVAAAYTFWRQDFGARHDPQVTGRRPLAYALLLGAAIGFYDGFFGPGTGSLLIFLFIRIFGFDFLHASAAAKIVNVATNFAALAYFVPAAHWLPVIAVLMAVCNIFGSWLGSHLALKHGSQFVRKLFLLVVVMLILRVAWDTFLAL